MARYAKISRPQPDCGGYYVQPLGDLKSALDGELDGIEIGEQILIEIIEMDEAAYADLPDFEGW
jgi:hypothetical protein